MYNQIHLEKRLKTILLFIILLSCELSVAATISSVSSGNWSASAWPNTSRTGSIITSTNSKEIHGLGTLFTTEISVGNIIKNSSNTVIGTVESIQSNTTLTLTSNATITNISPISYNFQGIGPSDNASIANGHTVTIDGDYTCNGLNISATNMNTSLVFSSSREYTFIATGTLSLSAPTLNGVTILFDIGINNVTVNAVTFSSSNSLRPDKISISSGTFKCKGNFQISISAASIFESTGSSTVILSGTVASFTLTQAPGSTFIYNSLSNQVIRPSIYTNLTIAGAGTKTSSSVTVNGTFSIDSISNLSTAITYGSAAKLKYNTAVNRTATNNEWPTTFTGTGGIEIANVGQITLNANKTLANNIPLMINTGAKLNTNSTNNYSLSFGGNFTNNGTLLAGSSNVLITGSATTQTIGSFSTTGALNFTKTAGGTTLADNFNVGDVNISGAGTLNFGSYFHTINGTLTTSSGILNLNTSSIKLLGNFIINGGTVNAEQSSFSYAGNNQTIAGINYYNFSFIGDGTQTLSNSTISILNTLNITDSVIVFLGTSLTIGGDLNISSKANFFANSFTLNIGGNISVSELCTFEYTQASLILDGTNQSFINLNSNQFTLNNLTIRNGIKTFNSELKTTGSLTIEGNSKLKLGEQVNLEIAGNFYTSDSTSTLLAKTCGNANNTLRISGNGSIASIYMEPGFQHFQNLYYSKTSSSVIFENDVAFSETFEFTGSTTYASFKSELNLYGENLNMVNTTNKVKALDGFSLRIGNYTTCSIGVPTTTILPNDMFTSTSVNVTNLKIDAGPSKIVQLGNQTINIISKLELLSGSLNTNNKMVLKSSSSKTARVASIPSGSNVSGYVTVERFIPGGEGKRKWRLLSSPINVNGSISLGQYKDDIFVTAPAGISGGFDVNPYSTNASIRTYDETLNGGSSIGWENPASINNTINIGNAVEVFVRGSRNLANPYLNWTIPDDVTIDYIGNLNIGYYNIILSYTSTNDASADGFNLIGNPFASPINFDTLGWSKKNIHNKYWCYNPTTGMYGIYDASLHAGTNSITKYIASGQGFFVQAYAAPATINFGEHLKCSNSPENTYYKGNTKTTDTLALLRIKLENDNNNTDEAMIYLSENGHSYENDEHDATKFYNDALNVYTTTPTNRKLAINETNFPTTIDTINLCVWSYDSSMIMKTHHQFNFEGINSIPTFIDLFLLDKFNSGITNIRNQPHYDFNISDDVNSYGNNRFKIILKNNGTFVESLKKSSLMIYPNPTSTILNIINENLTKRGSYKIELFDINGILLFSKDTENTGNYTSIDVSMLSAGVYLLKMDGEVKYFVKH